MSPNDLIDRLFPLPSLPPKGCPGRFPGVTQGTKLAVTKTLKENHVKLYGFRDEQGLHNHMSHQLLAVFAMGGSVPLYEAIYKYQAPQLRPAFQAPEAITDDNYEKYLGHRDYYDSYLTYFHDVVLRHNFSSVLEQYIFSYDANFPEAGAPRHMVNRLVARLLHPIIYVGYGLEFNIPGLVAEGLAQMACHPQEAPSLLVPSDFAEASTKRVNGTTTASGKEKPSVHAFTVLERIMKDDRFKQSSLGLKGHDDPFEAVYLVEHVGKEAGASLVQYTEDWLPDGASADILDDKVEQLSWLATLLYGVGGWTKDGFLPDFYIMHVVTSSLFLPAYRAYISPASFTVLLRVFLRTTLTWYVSRGRAPLNIREFYAKTNPAPQPKPEDKLSVPADANPWLSIIQQSLAHNDDHLPKTQRALAHFATVYGDRVAGTFSGLDGAELVEGSLFARVAELTAKVADTTTTQLWHFGGYFETK